MAVSVDSSAAITHFVVNHTGGDTGALIGVVASSNEDRGQHHSKIVRVEVEVGHLPFSLWS